MQRKLHAAIATLGIGLTGTAFAQSSVTLYGIVDQSIRFTNNSDAANGNLVQLTNGAITNSRWGLKGEEDLGGGLKAVFRLESGFEPQTGQLDQGGRIFGRYAYVGLAGKLGTVTLGRQGTEAFNFFGDFDPLTVGNYTANSWPFFMTVGRIDNAATYAGQFGGLHLGATYGFGNQPGSLSESSSWSLRTSYDLGPASFGGTYQQTRDINNNIQRMWGLGAKYAAGPATLFAGYMGGQDATGFVDEALNDPSRTVATGSFSANKRRDMTLYTGVNYQATPALALTGAFYYDDMHNINGFAGNNGERYTGVLLAEYSLSKATQVYGTVDYNHVSGGAYTELPGKNNQTGVAVGIRHMF
ncbi:MAG TPA: porin [Paraburkholderia sp.]|uniref:porin n=1 Tax=Paraburkholderia sp. TaxID=1926495 RepID=UPI002CC70815|nr:porin [Paraburkholderia sp.]HTR10499.1 porin [Paraburkholderia sp.]